MINSIEEAVVILENAIKKPNTRDGYLGQAIDMAIKALKKNIQPETCPITNGVCGYPIEDCCNCPNIKAMLDLANKALEQTRWIPVSERLPKKTGWYFITFKVYGGGYAVCELCYRKPENYWTRDDIRKKILDNDEVVAWMPLPELYKESEGEE